MFVVRHAWGMRACNLKIDEILLQVQVLCYSAMGNKVTYSHISSFLLMGRNFILRCGDSSLEIPPGAV